VHAALLMSAELQLLALGLNIVFRLQEALWMYCMVAIKGGIHSYKVSSI